MKKSKKQVLVGLSGGVDSAVAAKILQKKFKVRGVFLRIFKSDERGFFGKIRGAARFFFEKKRIKKLAKKLKIEIEFFDAREIFRQKILKKFLREIQNFRVLNPCVFCNAEIKFQILNEIARRKNCEKIATGHYAKVNGDRLFRARDLQKDQSLFLSRVSKKILQKLILPLENFSKKEIFKIAKRENLTKFLPRKQSQNLCFLSQNFTNFLRENLPPKFFKIGNFIDLKSKKILGKHRGVLSIFVGQRARIGGLEKPLFVQKICSKKNEILVGENCELFCKKIFLENLKIFREFQNGEKIFAQLRHRGKLHFGKIFAEKISKKNSKTKKSAAKIIFENVIRAINAGQTVAIFSRENEVIASGIFKSANFANCEN